MLLTQATVREHFDAVQRGDHEKVAVMLDAEFVQDWPQSGERVRGRDACLRIYATYPGGGPPVALKRIVGSGDVWVTEADADYGGKMIHMVSILEFRGDLLIHETDYFADPFEAPEWRRKWVERLA